MSGLKCKDVFENTCHFKPAVYELLTLYILLLQYYLDGVYLHFDVNPEEKQRSI